MSKAVILSDKIGKNNLFEDDVLIGDDVVIGDNNIFRKGTVIMNAVEIGNNNLFSNYVVVGSQGEMGLKGDVLPENGKVKIGNNNKIREFVVISFPAKTKLTSVGNDNYFMSRSHIPHDCFIDSRIVMAPNSALGGGVKIESSAFIGLGATAHHWVTIGEGSMIGMQAAVSKSVPPFLTVVGVPSKIISVNRIGALRNNIDEVLINEVENNLKEILNGGYDNKENFLIGKIRSFLNQNDCINSIIK